MKFKRLGYAAPKRLGYAVPGYAVPAYTVPVPAYAASRSSLTKVASW